jgi:hypothetical protein
MRCKPARRDEDTANDTGNDIDLVWEVDWAE